MPEQQYLLPFYFFDTTGAIPYRIGGFIKKVTNCNGFIAINTGDQIAFVNDQILYPGTIGTNVGDSITIGGNAGELFMGNIKLSFDPTVGTVPEVTITQKHYIVSPNKQLFPDK